MLEKLIQYLERHKIVTETGCWETGLKPEPTGYVRTIIDGKHYFIHRMSAAYYHGLDLNNDKILALHKNECHNKACWNPEHIYVGTQKQNINDVIKLGNKNNFGDYSFNRNKTHCGICNTPYDNKNTRKYRGKRYCRNCARIKSREYSRKRLEINPKNYRTK